jgi:hypothetical protein
MFGKKMSEIKLKFVLNKGRHGILLHKLTRIADEAEKFLLSFSEDLNLDKNEWVADSFRNGSVSFTISYVGPAEDKQLNRARKALAIVADPKTKVSDLNGDLSNRTYVQFAKIAHPIDSDDVIGLGVVNEKGKLVTKDFTKERAIQIEREMNVTTEEFIGFQGEITAMFREGSCWVKDSITSDRIVCKFKPNQYRKIWQLLKDLEGFVDIEGWAVMKNGTLDHLKIESIDASADYQEGDIDKFFGSAPNFTGNMTTGEYLSELRDEDSD